MTEHAQEFSRPTGRSMIRHVLITASLSALILLGIGGYQAYLSTLPVPVGQSHVSVDLTPDETEFMERTARVAPPLGDNPKQTIAAVLILCPTIRSDAQGAYKPMIINALSTSRYVVARAAAEIIAVTARQTICKVG